MNLYPSTTQNDLIVNNWFSENNTFWNGQKFLIEVEEVLENVKSNFQDILVFKSKTYGNVLVLDGVIQVTEKDEKAYQEMISHIPLFLHNNPKKVLIIGGGDGGVLREVCKHSCVQEIHMCEIDEQVIEISKKYFSKSLATSFDDHRLKLIINDAIEYLLTDGKDEKYDIIICDSSDPIGPAEVLFTPSFFKLLKDVLSDKGVICTQCECPWLHLDLINNTFNETKKIFNNVKYAYTSIPSYPCGQIGFIVASNNTEINLSVPQRDIINNLNLNLNLKFYSKKLHNAAFILPKFILSNLLNKNK